MPRFSVSVRPGAAISNLAVTSTGLTVQFTWTPQRPTEKVQIFKSTDSTRSDAVLLGATYDHNYQDALNATSGTVYYWLSIINDWGGVGPEQGPISATVNAPSGSGGGSVTIANGSITPAMLNNSFAIDPTSGNLKSGVVGSSQIASGTIAPTHLASSISAINNSTGALANGVVGVTNLASTGVSSSSMSSSIGGGTGSLSDYNTWHSFCTFSFTASAHSFYQIYMYLILQYGTPSISSGNSVTVSARFRLNDTTVGADVPAGTQYRTLYNAMNIGGTTVVYANNTVAEINMTFAEGFRNQLIAGHSYILYGEVSRTGSASINVPVSITTSSANGSSAVLA